MIKHVVCFKLKEDADKNQTAEILKSMKDKVPTVLDLEVGVDFLNSERSYDIILIVTLKDREALNEYQNDEYHCSVVKKYMHAVRTSSVAVDFEI